MHVRIALASNALSTTGLPMPVANAIHAGLADFLNTHGRLVFGDDPEVLALVRTVRSGEGIPPGARARWNETLIHLKKHGRIQVLRANRTPVAEVVALDALRSEWGCVADVAIVADDAGEVLGIPADSGIFAEPDVAPDVAITSAATNSPAVSHLRTKAANGFEPHGSLREDFWTQVLEPLAVEARSITVVDGYMFRRTWQAVRGRSSHGRDGADHLSWLLGHLDEVMTPGGTVRLIGNAFERGCPDASETAEAIRLRWSPSPAGRIGRVAVTLAETRRGEKFPHDRWIRFSTGCAVKFEAGLDRLHTSAITDPDGMAWKFMSHNDALSALRDSEERATSYAGPDADVIHR